MVLDYPLVWWGLAVLSVATLVISAVLIPPLIARLPADYYRPGVTPVVRSPRTAVGVAVCILRNGLGVCILRNGLGWMLVLAGVLMLVLPGQGLLTILAGLALVDFPGKRSAERWVLQAPGIRRLVQWSRERAGKEPLQF